MSNISADLYIEQNNKTYVLPNTSAVNVKMISDSGLESTVEDEIKTLRSTKANDNTVVHRTNNEDISGIKTFNSPIDITKSYISASEIVNTNDINIKIINSNSSSIGGLFLKTDGFDIVASGITLKGTSDGLLNVIHDKTTNTIPFNENLVHTINSEEIDGIKTFLKNITIKNDLSSLIFWDTSYENGVKTTVEKLSSIYFNDRTNETHSLTLYNAITQDQATFTINYTNPTHKDYIKETTGYTADTSFKICYDIEDSESGTDGKIKKVSSPYMLGPSFQTGTIGKIVTTEDIATSKNDGIVTTGEQTFSGNKIFNNNVTIKGVFGLEADIQTKGNLTVGSTENNKKLTVYGNISIPTITSATTELPTDCVPNISYLDTHYATDSNVIHKDGVETIVDEKTISYENPKLSFLNSNPNDKAYSEIVFKNSVSSIHSYLRSYKDGNEYKTILGVYPPEDDSTRYAELVLKYPVTGNACVVVPSYYNADNKTGKVITDIDYASPSNCGIVTTYTQSFAGTKSFTDLEITSNLNLVNTETKSSCLQITSNGSTIFDIKQNITTSGREVQFTIYKTDVDSKSAILKYDTNSSAYLEVPSYYNGANGKVITDLDVASSGYGGILTEKEQDISGKKTFLDGIYTSSLELAKAYVTENYDPTTESGTYGYKYRVTNIKYIDSVVSTQITEKVDSALSSGAVITDLQNQIINNSNAITTINKTLDTNVVKIDEEQNISGIKTFTNGLITQNTNSSTANDKYKVTNIAYVSNTSSALYSTIKNDSALLTSSISSNTSNITNLDTKISTIVSGTTIETEANRILISGGVYTNIVQDITSAKTFINGLYTSNTESTSDSDKWKVTNIDYVQSQISALINSGLYVTINTKQSIIGEKIFENNVSFTSVVNFTSTISGTISNSVLAEKIKTTDAIGDESTPIYMTAEGYFQPTKTLNGFLSTSSGGIVNGAITISAYKTEATSGTGYIKLITSSPKVTEEKITQDNLIELSHYVSSGGVETSQYLQLSTENLNGTTGNADIIVKNDQTSFGLSLYETGNLKWNGPTLGIERDITSETKENIKVHVQKDAKVDIEGVEQSFNEYVALNAKNMEYNYYYDSTLKKYVKETALKGYASIDIGDETIISEDSKYQVRLCQNGVLQWTGNNIAIKDDDIIIEKDDNQKNNRIEIYKSYTDDDTETSKKRYAYITLDTTGMNGHGTRYNKKDETYSAYSGKFQLTIGNEGGKFYNDSTGTIKECTAYENSLVINEGYSYLDGTNTVSVVGSIEYNGLCNLCNIILTSHSTLKIEAALGETNQTSMETERETEVEKLESERCVEIKNIVKNVNSEAKSKVESLEKEKEEAVKKAQEEGKTEEEIEEIRKEYDTKFENKAIDIVVESLEKEKEEAVKKAQEEGKTEEEIEEIRKEYDTKISNKQTEIEEIRTEYATKIEEKKAEIKEKYYKQIDGVSVGTEDGIFIVGGINGSQKIEDETTSINPTYRLCFDTINGELYMEKYIWKDDKYTYDSKKYIFEYNKDEE